MGNHFTSNMSTADLEERYEQLLKEHEATLKKLHFMEAFIDDIPLPIFVRDENGVFLSINKACENFFEISRDVVLNKTIKELDYLTKEELNANHEDALQSVKDLGCLHSERVYTVNNKKKPSLFWSKAFVTPQTGERGLVAAIVDITKQKMLENALAQKVDELNIAQENINLSRERMRVMLDNMPLAAQIWSTDGQLLDASLESTRLFEFETLEDCQNNFTSTTPEYQPNGKKSLEYIQETLDLAHKEGSAFVQWLHVDKMGNPVPIDINVKRSSLYGETVLLVFLKDMREHHAQMEKLHEADNYTRLMLDLNPYGTLIWDHNLTLVHCNKALSVTFGLKESEDFIRHFLELIPEFQPDGNVSLETMQNVLLKALDEGFAECFWQGISITGEEIPCNVHVVRTKYRGEFVLIAYVKDLRESEAQKKKVEIAEQRMSAILEGVPLGIVLLSPEFQVLDCNEEAVRITDYDNKEHYLEHFYETFPLTQPDGEESMELNQRLMIAAKEQGFVRHEIWAVDRHQSDLPLDVKLINQTLEHEDLFIAYAHDLRETKSMLKEIELSRQAAEQSDRAKSDFLANMSHEIRTPMNGILGLLHLLSNTSLTDHQQEYLQKALFSTNELLRIINDILDFSKIEAGKLEMENIDFTVHGVCSELHNLFEHTINKKNLSFQLDEGKLSNTTLIGDPLRLKQVLLNLLSNAIKFTSEGSVSLLIETDLKNIVNGENKELHCKFTVKDTGIGLSSEQISSLFSAFTQADTSVTRKYGGTGLGLAICKRIVKMMRGDIWVESIMGQGSSFIFTATFPLSTNQESKSPIASTFNAQEMKIHNEHLLLVEDNEINQLIAKGLLKKAGYTVDIANHGQEALEMLEKKQYAAVLMDIQMPIMDGLTATQRIRQQAQFANLPVIAMSAHAMSGDKEKSILHGMNDHITKPISPGVLYATLDYWLSGQGKKAQFD